MISSHARSRAASAVAFALALSMAAGAAAQPAGGGADQHFKHGVELHKDADYAGALVEFKRAYELDPRYQVLYNIGESYFQLQDYANALRTFQKYLNEGAGKITGQRRLDVERDVEKLRKRVARLEILTKEPGATITVDDQPMGKTPLDEALLLSAGRRKVTASMPGRAPATQIVDLAGGDNRSITIEVPKVEVQRVEVIVPGPVASTVPVLPWVVTGALAGGAIITGALALSASGDLKDKLDAFPGDPSAISSARSRTAAFAIVTDVLIGSAAVAAGVSVYLTLHKPAPANAASGGAVILVARPGSLGLTGSF